MIGAQTDIIAAMVFLGVSFVCTLIYALNSEKRWSFSLAGAATLFMGVAFSRMVDVLMFLQTLPS